MALSLSTNKTSYLVGENATATLTGTAAELARAQQNLGSAGGIRSGMQYMAPGSVAWSDTAGRTWTFASRTSTSVTATTGPLAGTGTATVTATLGSGSASAAYAVKTTPGGGGGVQMRGVTPWFNPFMGALVNRAATMLDQPWVGGISAFCRWEHLSTNGTTWNFAGFDKIAAAAALKRKPWALMVILGNEANGLPAYVQSAVPASQKITTDGGTFPVFWSPVANSLLDAMMDKLAARYASDPWLAQVRVTGFWSTHGEPWFAGGEAGKPKWAAAWRATHAADAGLSDAAALVKVQNAYDVQDRQWWADAAARWPSRINLAAAAGDALYDNALSPGEWEKPARHPRRLANWTLIRAAHGSRVNYQFNGVGAGDGASGYGRWLPNSFGPHAVSPADGIAVPPERRGRIGSQPVAGAGTDRLTYAGFSQMIRNLTDWGYSYCEVYASDVADAIDGANANHLGMRAVMIERKDDWAP